MPVPSNKIAEGSGTRTMLIPPVTVPSCEVVPNATSPPAAATPGSKVKSSWWSISYTWMPSGDISEGSNVANVSVIVAPSRSANALGPRVRLTLSLALPIPTVNCVG